MCIVGRREREGLRQLQGSAMQFSITINMKAQTQDKVQQGSCLLRKQPSTDDITMQSVRHLIMKQSGSNEGSPGPMPLLQECIRLGFRFPTYQPVKQKAGIKANR
jgi:hypothetical protein